MISLIGDCFNGLYLRALNLAISLPRTYESSRAGSVINLGQAYIEINANDPRLVFLNHRRLNPVFAIIEGAWVLAGSNKLAPLKNEIANFHLYSDDGETLNGAYGSRLQTYFGIDQVSLAVDLLKANHNTRRVVLTIYSPNDLLKVSKDIPCNTSIYLKVRDNKLDITVLNRSNDLYLGLPYNVFVFGLLQRLVSKRLGIRVGRQRHFSDSLHLYEKEIRNAEQIVLDNDIEAVRRISNEFDWEYSDIILDNTEEILAGKFDAIKNHQLSLFLTNFNKKSREQQNTASNRSSCTNDFFGFLTYQWLSSDCIDSDQWELKRRMMMNNGIRKKLEVLCHSPGYKIAQNISALALQLKGELSALKEAIEKESGPYSLRAFEGEEVVALHTILLCAVWTTLDPYLSNTPIGTKAKQEIMAAADLLNVPFSNVGPLSRVEDALFSALSKVLD